MRAAVLLLALACACPARAAFRAAAGKRDITPDLKKESVYLAGYGAKGRKAEGVEDKLYARALVVSDGTSTVALVSVDLIGLYRRDVADIRETLGWTGPARYLFLAATHDHSGPDTVGLWGPLPGVSGVDRRYRKRVKAAVAELVREAAGRLRPAELAAAKAELDPAGLCRDLRDPAVLDTELNALQARDSSGTAIATVVRWSCHAEVLGRSNKKVTADYPGALCARVEAKTGGECLYLPGVIGGLLSPVTDHEQPVERQFEAMRALGGKVADAALAALAKDAERFKDPEIAFSTQAVRLRADNSRYLLFLRSVAFGHELYSKSGRRLAGWKTYWYPLRHLALFPLPERLRPWIEAELALVRLGPVRLLGVPGELFPELALGGYDGSRRWGYPLVGPANPNPPDFAKAPRPPYLREKLGVKHGLIVGPANDMIGYIIPEYDFQITKTRSMSPKPPGTHYEETNSLGPGTAAAVLKGYDALLAP